MIANVTHLRKNASNEISTMGSKQMDPQGVAADCINDSVNVSMNQLMPKQEETLISHLYFYAK